MWPFPNSTFDMPNKKYRKAGVLNELDVASFIMFLDEKKEVYATEMKPVISNYDRVKRLAEKIQSEGLIEINVEEYPRVKITYKLTPKGKKIAQKLMEIDALLEG